VAKPKAPLLAADGSRTKDVSLEDAVFASEVKPHLVHETVRAELNAERAGTRTLKSRGLVAGGRSKPWRQKGTGRARQGTIRAPQFKGGGAAFMPATSFDVKVNRKARRAAMRGALSAHASAGTLAVVDGMQFEEPSTRTAAELVDAWEPELPLVVVATEAEENLIKSFRNLERTLVTLPSELTVATVVWARALLVSEAALPLVEARANGAAQAPVRASGPGEGARGNREVPPEEGTE
jgi:large subunit ribosomal protein L4